MRWEYPLRHCACQPTKTRHPIRRELHIASGALWPSLVSRVQALPIQSSNFERERENQFEFSWSFHTICSLCAAPQPRCWALWLCGKSIRLVFRPWARIPASPTHFVWIQFLYLLAPCTITNRASWLLSNYQPDLQLCALMTGVSRQSLNVCVGAVWRWNTWQNRLFFNG